MCDAKQLTNVLVIFIRKVDRDPNYESYTLKTVNHIGRVR